MNTLARYLPFFAALCVCNFAVVSSNKGLWTTCHGFPPKDVFRAPNGEVPAYTTRYHRLGTLPSTSRCYATFSYQGNHRYAGPPGHGDIVVLRKYDKSKSGNGYKWVNYRNFLSKLESCTPVEYSNKYNAQICYMPGVRVRDAKSKKWTTRGLLGSCWTNRKAYATYGGRRYIKPVSWTYRNAKVLCLTETTSIELAITHVDTINSANMKSTPNIFIHDSTVNSGSTPVKFTFIKKYTETLSSRFSTEHGWKLEVSTTISGGVLSDAIARFQTTITAGGHGTYITDKVYEKTEELTYQREFEIPPNYIYTISCIIYKQRISVGYQGTEKHYDKNDNLIHEHDVSGTWTGVSTVQGKTTVSSKKVGS